MGKSWKTDYAGHERRYAQLKQSGARGWATALEVEQYLAYLETFLAPLELVKPGVRTLELGCGGAQISAWLAMQGCVAKGIDIAATAVELAEQNFRDHQLAGEFRVGDVLALPKDWQAQFDLVIDGHCLHCIIGPDRATFFEQCRRALAPGGALVVKTMCGEVTDEALLKHFDRESRCMVHDGGVASRYIGEAKAIAEEVRSAGFSIQVEEVYPRQNPGELDDLMLVAQLIS